MIRLSIVIPVYNAAAFIKETITFLLEQTLQGCEFIFVNDGSSDNSLEILNEFAAKENCIKVLDQHNQGISTARNNGLAIATGAYVGFMDNDDAIKPDMLETLYNEAIANQADIVVSRTLLERDGKFILKDNIFDTGIVYDNTFCQEQIIPNLLKSEDMFAVWNKIYKRSFIEKFNVRFPANRNIEEDSMFNFQAFNKAQRIIFTPYAGYFYRDVGVNESRKFIERDYFARALERYHFPYKSTIGFNLEDDKMKLFTSIRFVHRVFYLLFRIASDKKDPLSRRTNYITKMVKHPDVIDAIQTYNNEQLEVKGRFEIIIITALRKRQFYLIKPLVMMIDILYSKQLSEFLRKLNNTKSGEIQHAS